jgi:hypothetical protein
MDSHETHTVTFLSRRKVLFITLVGIGALTFCYVLGVHMGRQSTALGSVVTSRSGEDLCKLPATIHDQIKALDDVQFSRDVSEPEKPVLQQAPAVNDAVKVSVDKKVVVPAKTVAIALSKSELRRAEKDRRSEETTRWTTQLMSTPDLAEAQRMMAKVQAAGFSAVVISDRGLFKVRLAKAGSREMVDSLIAKLKTRGFKPFAIRIG